MRKLTKPLENDTDSLMTDRDTTQNQKIGEIPNNCFKEEPKEIGRNNFLIRTQSRPEIKDWLNQEWNKAEWAAWDYYYWPFAT